MEHKIDAAIEIYTKIFETVDEHISNPSEWQPSIRNLWRMFKSNALMSGSIMLKKNAKPQLSSEWSFKALIEMKLSSRAMDWPSAEYITECEQIAGQVLEDVE